MEEASFYYKMKDGELVQEHIKTITELFNELSVVGDAVKEKDKVIYLLASLPESYNTLVTTLEVNETVPKIETVTERILHAERKQTDKDIGGVMDGREDGVNCAGREHESAAEAKIGDTGLNRTSQHYASEM